MRFATYIIKRCHTICKFSLSTYILFLYTYTSADPPHPVPHPVPHPYQNTQMQQSTKISLFSKLRKKCKTFFNYFCSSPSEEVSPNHPRNNSDDIHRITLSRSAISLEDHKLLNQLFESFNSHAMPSRSALNSSEEYFEILKQHIHSNANTLLSENSLNAFHSAFQQCNASTEAEHLKRLSVLIKFYVKKRQNIHLWISEITDKYEDLRENQSITDHQYIQIGAIIQDIYKKTRSKLDHFALEMNQLSLNDSRYFVKLNDHSLPIQDFNHIVDYQKGLFNLEAGELSSLTIRDYISYQPSH